MENKEKMWAEDPENPCNRRINEAWVVFYLKDMDDRLISIQATYLAIKWLWVAWIVIDAFRVGLAGLNYYNSN